MGSYQVDTLKEGLYRPQKKAQKDLIHFLARRLLGVGGSRVHREDRPGSRTYVSFWVAVKEFSLSYCIGETLLIP